MLLCFVNKIEGEQFSNTILEQYIMINKFFLRYF